MSDTQEDIKQIMKLLSQGPKPPLESFPQGTDLLMRAINEAECKASRIRAIRETTRANRGSALANC